MLLVLVGGAAAGLAGVVQQRARHLVDCVGAGPVQQRAVWEEPAAAGTAAAAAEGVQ
jgi:hypothetical protein